MRAFIVEDVNKVIELRLLLREVQTGRLGGFLLQVQMHSLMAAILLRMARPDPLDPNSQAQPPNRKLAQVEEGMGRSEGKPVITTAVGRQTAFFKQSLKDRKGEVFAGRGQRLAGQQVAAGMIGDGQRVAVVTIAEQELALVIRAPQFIGTLAER